MNKETVDVEALRKRLIELRSARSRIVDEEDTIAKTFRDALEIGDLYDVTRRSDYPVYKLITDIPYYDSDYEPDEAIHDAMSDSCCTYYVEVLFIQIRRMILIIWILMVIQDMKVLCFLVITM